MPIFRLNWLPAKFSSSPAASFCMSGCSVDTFLPCCCFIRWTSIFLCLQQFCTFGRSVDTCFAMLLGDISVQTTPSAPGAETLNGLKGLVGVAATLFFWTYELLVFMVLLNFLLAIIVDAFSEVKENTHETIGGLAWASGALCSERQKKHPQGCS